MKAPICILLLLTLRLGFADSLSQARQELLPSLHLSMYKLAEQQMSHKFNSVLFEQQTRAIEVVGKFGDSSDVPLLFPYLDYPGGNAYSAMSLSMSSTAEDLEEEWPAFGAIANIPHSREALYAYAVGQSNPIDNRLNAIFLLWYLAPESFKECSKTIKENEAGNTKLLAYVALIQRGMLQFHGFLTHAELDQKLKHIAAYEAQNHHSP